MNMVKEASVVPNELNDACMRLVENARKAPISHTESHSEGLDEAIPMLERYNSTESISELIKQCETLYDLVRDITVEFKQHLQDIESSLSIRE